MVDPTSPSIPFQRAFLHALRDPRTYDVRSNARLWLGFTLAVPIPVLAIGLSAPGWVVLASLFAPIGWGVIVGAARRVGTIGEDLIRKMRLQALSDRRLGKEVLTSLNRVVDKARTERAKLQRYQRMADAELALAQTIHESLVPMSTTQEDVVVAIRHIPCTCVGGDYIQVSFLRSDVLYLCAGDVAGHGVAAALVVSRIHGLVERLILQDVGPGPFLQALDRAMVGLLENTALSMTFAVLRIDLSARRIRYATAGHPPQYLLRAGGAVEELMTGNPPLGLDAPEARPEPSVGDTTYESGDTLLLSRRTTLARRGRGLDPRRGVGVRRCAPLRRRRQPSRGPPREGERARTAHERRRAGSCRPRARRGRAPPLR